MAESVVSDEIELTASPGGQSYHLGYRDHDAAFALEEESTRKKRSLKILISMWTNTFSVR